VVRSLRIAIVHEWLTTYAGAERVLEQLLLCFPEADLFAVVDFVPDNQRAFLQGKKPRTTFIQRLPFAKTKYRAYLSLMPLAIEQLDLSGYDLVISSNHAVAKGVITGPTQLHVSYVYSPMRYAWDLQHQYLRQAGLQAGLKSWLARYQLHRLRLWDQSTANRVDAFVTLSHFVAGRIAKFYRREATVIYPPVDLQYFAVRKDKEEFYVTASRMVPYKRMDVIVEAFAQMPGKRLVVIGEGPERKRIEAKGGPNVDFLGYRPNEVIRDYLQRGKAFLFAAEEDFGILPLEAQACGTPVIAYGRGGALETIRGLDHDRPSGLFFESQTPQAIVEAIGAFEEREHLFNTAACRKNAERFAPQRFRDEIEKFVKQAWEEFEAGLEPLGR